MFIRNGYFKTNLKENLIMEVKDSYLVILFPLFTKPLSLVCQKKFVYICAMFSPLLVASLHVAPRFKMGSASYASASYDKNLLILLQVKKIVTVLWKVNIN